MDVKRITINPKTMYKVRFHLGAGEHFMHWQVKNVKTNHIEYIPPEKFSIVMHECKLRNHKSTAKKINEGANKTVCAWIECEDLRITSRTIPGSVLDWELRYNPRVEPRWTDSHGQGDYDNQEFDFLWTEGRKVLTTETCKEEQ